MLDFSLYCICRITCMFFPSWCAIREPNFTLAVFTAELFPLSCFSGNVGYRLRVPPVGFALSPHLQEEHQEGHQEVRAEVQIARKLQCIADQFHRLHVQRVSCFCRRLGFCYPSVALCEHLDQMNFPLLVFYGQLLFLLIIQNTYRSHWSC